MATDIQHENLDGIFRLWLNWVMVAGAISLLVILSLWLPPAAMPVLAIVFQIGFFMQVRANRRKKMPSCYILPFLATRIFFWTAVVMVAVLYLYSRHLIENIFDGDTINAEIPFITVLIIGPVAVAVTLFAVARGGRLRFCRDCKIRNGFPAERGFLGNLFSQEGTYQTRMLLNVSALVTLVGWVYYFLAYVNVNLNEPDRLVFFWTPLTLFIITIVVMAVRYLGLCNYYEQHFEGSGQQMRRSTMLRYIIIADNTIVLRKPQSDPDMDMGFTAACYDTPASLVIPHRQSIPDDEAHTLSRRSWTWTPTYGRCMSPTTAMPTVTFSITYVSSPKNRLQRWPQSARIWNSRRSTTSADSSTANRQPDCSRPRYTGCTQWPWHGKPTTPTATGTTRSSIINLRSDCAMSISGISTSTIANGCR